MRLLHYSISISIAWLLTGLPCLALAAPTTELAQQRQAFQQARQAIKQHDSRTLQQLYPKLAHYPLTPYLKIWEAFQWVEQEKDYDVWKVLQNYGDIPESTSLRQAWLKSLAKRGQWPQVAEQLQYIPAAQRKYPLIHVRAQWYNGHPQEAALQLTRLWQDGASLPEHSSRLIAAWKAAGHPTHHDIWQRLIHLIRHGKWQEVHRLQHRLTVQEQAWVKLWQKVQDKPEHGLMVSHTYHVPPDIMARISKDGLRRLARHDIDTAWAVLQHLKPQLNRDDFLKQSRYLALRAAKKHHLPAITWLSTLPANMQTNDTQAWQVRLLLLKKDWKQALKALQDMPEKEQVKARWLYWQAYIWEKLQHPDMAKPLYAQAALERGYYSFLSAQRLKQPYMMGAITPPEQDIQAWQQQAPLQRAKEWLYWHENNKAAAEWYAALRHADKATWLKALQLAMTWNWHEQAIRAASRAGLWDALEARFPMGYQPVVHHEARRNHLSNSLIWSMIRQESAFNPDARSRTGARGLMQLMPATARHIVKKHHLKPQISRQLNQPEYNIRLGSLYIADMLKRFEGQEALAIAAYNAGPNRVASWLNDLPLEDEALWVELIPFHETRRYVQHVMSFRIVYDWLQQQPAHLLAHK